MIQISNLTKPLFIKRELTDFDWSSVSELSFYELHITALMTAPFMGYMGFIESDLAF